MIPAIAGLTSQSDDGVLLPSPFHWFGVWGLGFGIRHRDGWGGEIVERMRGFAGLLEMICEVRSDGSSIDQSVSRVRLNVISKTRGFYAQESFLK